MKILLISDVHMMSNKLDICLRKERNINAVIFTGDGIDIVEDYENVYTNIPFYKVRGNVDYTSSEKEEKVITLEKKKIFITHGHNYGVKHNLNLLKERGGKLEVDIVLYGHTHIKHNEKYNGIYYINSGAISGERLSNEYTYNVLEIKEDNVIVKECIL